MKTAALVIGLWLGGGVLHTTAQRVNTDTLRTAASQIVLPQNLTLPDSLQAKITGTDTLKKKSKLGPNHSPRKAAMRSLAFPGLGQAYNKQYWKMPFVYAGLGASVFFLIQNHNRYCDFLEPFLNSYDLTTGLVKKEITPTTLIDVYVASQGQTRGLTLDQITRAKDTYRRWRDLNIIIIAGVWALNAVEANVSAHLLTFDMSDDISLRVSPDLQFSPLSPMPVWGVSAVFSIK
ncbi:MAG: hypothetical protein EAZ70_06520 [Runella slithyformis]|nr:MAG: hypothetical protein EAY79_04155 [Runella slithyformis]TAE91850.1 MAG: hypothetical protein EAZ80_12395 [Runella slithyformis]TAF27717.1 MAG: hypothetical protein EAZ70_06520 [Runella slithyformis]TAF44605.1 MAG: hypothetical protein EAZ63_12020 [Runella slithyformis]TAF80892.1 MAG: hypothetical protein EAZ50_07725 [Runella slithyformis]